MNATTPWQEANQHALMHSLGRVRAHLQRQVDRAAGKETAEPPAIVDAEDSALATLARAFQLSSFERDLLLICAGVELDSAFAALCAAAQGDTHRAFATFSLALAVLSEAHWSALVPAAPLRRWKLLEVGGGDSLTHARLRIDERILHYLTGISYLDERLQGIIEPAPAAIALPPSQQTIAQRMSEAWSRGSEFIQLLGEDETAKLQVAAAACAATNNRLFVLKAADIPGAASEREVLARLWQREAVLTGSVLLIDGAQHDEQIHSLGERLHGRIVIASREPMRFGARPVLHLEVPKPSAAEQENIWRDLLGAENGEAQRVVAQFNFSGSDIRAAHGALMSNGKNPAALWDVCRTQARQRLDGLAERIAPLATWNDLVLPASAKQILRDIALHVRERATVYERWNFRGKSARGLGISALFSGASGTGKTMAAEVLAGELQLDLYRIDLSSVVSKYIGETEKNLRRVFDAAEQSGAILFFDEADALFGKRTEVKDSHDRYANIEVSYLLQRMEAYRGLAILTTNLKQALDPAFLRRIRFVVPFPFPDAAQRAEIWRRIFPRETPTENLDPQKLARLNVAGGNIRNVALNAAFFAADANEPVRMRHLLRAARSEYAKLEKPLTEAEIGGWL